MRYIGLRLGLAVSAALCPGTGCGGDGAGGEKLPVERVSIASDGTIADGWSDDPAITADGRLVAFESGASNLGSPSGGIFLRDLETGRTWSLLQDASEATDDALDVDPAISADGRFVAFEGHAADFGLADETGFADVLVLDRETGSVEIVGVSSSGAQAELAPAGDQIAISGNGRYVAWVTAAARFYEGTDVSSSIELLYLHDRETGTTVRPCETVDGDRPTLPCETPALSHDGERLVFASRADHLVEGDDGDEDVFVYEVAEGALRRVSLASDGGALSRAGNPAISADGRVVTFLTAYDVLPDDPPGYDLYVRDLETGEVEVASRRRGDGVVVPDTDTEVSLSADGNRIAFRALPDGIVVRDRAANRLFAVSDPLSVQPEDAVSDQPRLSADGKTLAFVSTATNLDGRRDDNDTSDVFVASLP